MAKASVKLSPQQRAIENKRAAYAEHGWDIEEYINQGFHWEPLSDAEWLGLWKHLQTVGAKKALNENSIRKRVNDAAYSSGWFLEFFIFNPHAGDFRLWAKEDEAFLRKVVEFRAAATEFFIPPDDDPAEPYDPYPERKMLPVLKNLETRLRREIQRKMETAALCRDATPSAATPEYDLWRARLLQTWRDEIGLPVKNTKQLRGFMVCALSPYHGSESTVERGAKHFIEKWIKGEIQVPERSLMSRLSERSNKV